MEWGVLAAAFVLSLGSSVYSLLRDRKSDQRQRLTDVETRLDAAELKLAECERKHKECQDQNVALMRRLLIT